MDFGNTDEKLLDQNGQPQTQTQSQGPGSTVDTSSGGSNIVGAGTGTAPQTAGAGGTTGGWTNIQNYLNANESDQGGAQLLKNDANKKISDETSRIDADADKYRDGQTAKFQSSNIGQDQMKNLYSNAVSAYNWDSPQTPNSTKDFKNPTVKYGLNPNTDYRNSVSKVSNYMNTAWQDPEAWNATIGSDVQGFNGKLKDDSAFQSYMGDLYEGAAGHSLNAGQRALQNQFDVNNENTRAAREEALKGLAGLETHVNDRAKELGDYNSKLGDEYRTNQNANRDFLTNNLQSLSGQIQGAESRAKSDYNNDFNNGKSGFSSFHYGYYYPGSNTFGEDRSNQENLGIVSPNSTWSQLQREKDMYAPTEYYSRWASTPQAGNEWRQYGDDLENRHGAMAALNNFYSGEDAKYNNTADAEKRSWNVLADFLGLSDPRKTQGFKVRG